MAKSRVQIELDFKQAKVQADELDQIAKSLKGLADNNYGSQLNKVSQNWKGENANIYIKKGRKVKDEMITAARDLQKVASTVREIAKNTYNAEKSSLELANKRTWKGIHKAI